jgi:hypothetical protein
MPYCLRVDDRLFLELSQVLPEKAAQEVFDDLLRDE